MLVAVQVKLVACKLPAFKLNLCVRSFYRILRCFPVRFFRVKVKHRIVDEGNLIRTQCRNRAYTSRFDVGIVLLVFLYPVGGY